MSSTKSIIPLKPIDFEGTARAVEQFSRAHNIPSLSYPADASNAEGKGPQRGGLTSTTPRRMKRLPMEVPEYVMESLKRRALDTKGASVRFVVLSALRAYGIDVRDEELVKDKRRQDD